MNCFLALTVLAFASENKNDTESAVVNLGEKIMENAGNSIVVKIEADEYDKKKSNSSIYFGVSYHGKRKRWHAQRYSKMEKTTFSNGYHKFEETAAHASDTLAREIMANGKQNLELNFPDDNTEVHPVRKKEKSSNFIGVFYHEIMKRWAVQRYSKIEKDKFYYGYYRDEKTAAHASDTLARKLMANGENLKLNFPDDNTEVNAKEISKTSEFLGVYYNLNGKRWKAQRFSKAEKKNFSNGSYRYEVTAAHASDTLARKLMENGEEGHKLNFPADNTEVHAEEIRKKKKSKKFSRTIFPLY